MRLTCDIDLNCLKKPEVYFTGTFKINESELYIKKNRCKPYLKVSLRGVLGKILQEPVPNECPARSKLVLHSPALLRFVVRDS
jgi:hypothetical protein